MINFLDDTDIFIKSNLDVILTGKLEESMPFRKFTKEQLDKMLELSFLYNHLTFEKDSLVFRFGTNQVKITNLYEQYSDLVYQIGREGVKNMIVSQLTNTDEFKSALKSFLRDKKIESVTGKE